MKELQLSQFLCVKDEVQQLEKVSVLGQKINLIAVTKQREAEVLPLLAAAGIYQFAENRVQELIKKRRFWEEFISVENHQPEITWHLIGNLQKNKVKKAVTYADVIHSVDSAELYDALLQESEKQQKQIKAFLQVNVSGEESKHGFTPEAALAFYRTEILLLNQEELAKPYLTICGLMTMAPKEAEPQALKAIFASLRALRDQLNPNWRLSMGMSNDYACAISEGATDIRLGRKLFL